MTINTLGIGRFCWSTALIDQSTADDRFLSGSFRNYKTLVSLCLSVISSQHTSSPNARTMRSNGSPFAACLDPDVGEEILPAEIFLLVSAFLVLTHGCNCGVTKHADFDVIQFQRLMRTCPWRITELTRFQRFDF
jgi:hypothetical protein